MAHSSVGTCCPKIHPLEPTVASRLRGGKRRGTLFFCFELEAKEREAEASPSKKLYSVILVGEVGRFVEYLVVFRYLDAQFHRHLLVELEQLLQGFEADVKESSSHRIQDATVPDHGTLAHRHTSSSFGNYVLIPRDAL